ncbi:MAG: alpha/beta hydrolase [Phycisphaerales bacterium]
MRKLPAEMVTRLMAWREANPLPPPLESSVTTLDDGVTRYRNRRYLEGEERDALRHSLDLYRPADHAWMAGRPLVIWAHGGGWRLGGKDDLMGLYAWMAQRFAERGIATALVNYRLTPRVRHPGHIEDVAAAFHWIHERADEYGFSRDSMFVSGHSAGAHLVSLLALDPEWLEEYDLDATTVIRGVVAISGLYDLRSLARYLPEQLTETELARSDDPLARAGAAIPPEYAESASPIAHAKKPAPPTLLLYEEQWEVARDQALAMEQALRDAGALVEARMVEGTNHTSILGDLVRDESAQRDAIFEFIEKRGHHDDESTRR